MIVNKHRGLHYAWSLRVARALPDLISIQPLKPGPGYARQHRRKDRPLASPSGHEDDPSSLSCLVECLEVHIDHVQSTLTQ